MNDPVGSSPDNPGRIDLASAPAGSIAPVSLVALAWDGERWRIAHAFSGNRRGRRAAARIQLKALTR